MSNYKIALPHNAYNFGGDSVETTVTINVGEGFEKILTFNYKNLDTGDFYSIEGTPDNIEHAFLRNVDTLPSSFSSTVSDYLAQAVFFKVVVTFCLIFCKWMGMFFVSGQNLCTSVPIRFMKMQ